VGPPANATENWPVFSQAVDNAIAAARWPEAQQLAQSARFVAPAPQWLKAHESDLRWREILIAHGSQDASSFRLHLEQYLDGSEAHTVTAMELAHTANAAGDVATGVTISRAVLTKSPNHPLAISFLTQYLIPKKTKKG
jgi:hypothetical protein